MNSEGVSAAAREVRVRIARRRPPRVLLPQGFWLTLFYNKKKNKNKIHGHTIFITYTRGGRTRAFTTLYYNTPVAATSPLLLHYYIILCRYR